MYGAATNSSGLSNNARPTLRGEDERVVTWVPKGATVPIVITQGEKKTEGNARNVFVLTTTLKKKGKGSFDSSVEQPKDDKPVEKVVEKTTDQINNSIAMDVANTDKEAKPFNNVTAASSTAEYNRSGNAFQSSTRSERGGGGGYYGYNNYG